MGHYASEMDPDYGKNSAEVTARYEAGYRTISTFLLEIYACPKCYAAVPGAWWREHAEWHNSLLKGSQ